MTSDRPMVSPGEARTRQRRRRQFVYLGIAAVIGGILGGVVATNDSGAGGWFDGQYTSGSLDPALAIALAAGFFFALVAFPLWAFTQIDEMQRDQNLIGFTGGCLAVLAGFPMWALLHAGGHVGPPHAFGLFGISFAALIASFLYANLRS